MITIEKEKELDLIIEQAILFRPKDCHIERARKEWQRKQLKANIIKFISSL